MNELELRHLTLLLEIRNRARERLTRFDTDVEDFVLELRDSGASARGIADVIGVPASTIQTWTKNARHRRSTRPA